MRSNLEKYSFNFTSSSSLDINFRDIIFLRIPEIVLFNVRSVSSWILSNSSHSSRAVLMESYASVILPKSKQIIAMELQIGIKRFALCIEDTSGNKTSKARSSCPST
mmetsp:Transcript_21643/g.42506  ORF Transcript_21643/g.42506 Transcript_21643/m.42506 type:complete len:107 (-) Transcript_21643:1331-1651(-)